MENETKTTTALFLLELESSRKIPIVNPKCRIGRDIENDVVVSDDTSISRFHGVITSENGEYMVNDGGSRNGTFLNGNKVTAPEALKDGDMLKFGSTIFWVVIETDPE